MVAQFGYDTDGRGSRVTPFVPQATKSGTAGDSVEQLRNVSAMPEYQAKSPEELRFEDYKAGVMGQAGAQLLPSVHPNKVGQRRAPSAHSMLPP